MDGRAILLWKEGISFEQAMAVLPRIRGCHTLQDLREIVPILDQKLGQKLTVAYFPRDVESRRAA
jgi:hypothetical protein